MGLTKIEFMDNLKDLAVNFVLTRDKSGKLTYHNQIEIYVEDLSTLQFRTKMYDVIEPPRLDSEDLKTVLMDTLRYVRDDDTLTTPLYQPIRCL